MQDNSQQQPTNPNAFSSNIENSERKNTFSEQWNSKYAYT